MFAAATATAAEVERWFDYPIIRLGEQTITVLRLSLGSARDAINHISRARE
jgi:hypothetical protein